MEPKKSRLVLTVNLFLAAFVVITALYAFDAMGQRYNDLGTSVDILGRVYQYVLGQYYRPIDPTDLSKNAINGMMESLDPYSAFMVQSSFQQLQENSGGEFGGLGIEIAAPGDYPRVMAYPIEGTPADGVLRAGDLIVEVDSVSTYQVNLTDVVSRLRGRVGDPVTIKVRRVGVESPMTFTLIRGTIPLHNVQYAGVIEDGIGYIKLQNFNQAASQEMDDALNMLNNSDIEGLIFDLRGNPGGLLQAAVEVANKFLPRGDVIVFTKDRNGNGPIFRAPERPLFPDKPLIVLINQGSASASEIVAGALQDHDRGVLIGTVSFGKGSVQTVFEDLPEGYGLKLTTALYYTPSGRSIHKERSIADLTQMEMTGIEPETPASDSTTREEYYTLDLERIVYGGGGITPDIIVPEQTAGNMVSQLILQNMFQDFAVQYIADHPDLPLDFEVDRELVDEFKAFASDTTRFSYMIPGKTYLDDFRTRVTQEQYNGDILSQIDGIEQSLLEKRDEDFEAALDTIKLLIRREIVAAKFGSAERTVASKQWDMQLKKAIEVLKNPAEYQQFLSPGAETGITETVN